MFIKLIFHRHWCYIYIYIYTYGWVAERLESSNHETWVRISLISGRIHVYVITSGPPLRTYKRASLCILYIWEQLQDFFKSGIIFIPKLGIAKEIFLSFQKNLN